MIVVYGKNGGMNAEPLDGRRLDEASWYCLDSLTHVASITATGCHLQSTDGRHGVRRGTSGDRRPGRAPAAGGVATRRRRRPSGLAPMRPASDAVRAVRDVAARAPAGASPDGITVRVATGSDIDVLADLALEERLCHATRTPTGVSPDQPRETGRRFAEEAVATSADNSRHRGAGTGRALVDAALRSFAEERADSVSLHYVVDNRLSARFWTRLGFRPHLHTDGLWL